MDGFIKTVGGAVVGLLALGAIAAGAIDLPLIANLALQSGSAAYEEGVKQVESSRGKRVLPGTSTMPLGPAGGASAP